MQSDPVQTLQEASGDAEPPAGRVADPVADVAKLLNPDPPPAEQPPPETEDQAEPPAETWDLKSLAEKLGTDPEKLYGIKVALDGAELSIGELKDAYRPAAELEKARGKLVEEMTSSQREVAQARQELAALVNLLDRSQLSPELIQEAGRQSEQARTVEAKRTLERIPEWKDPITKAADWVDIRKAGKELGYTDAELALAEQGYADHRLLLALRRAARGAPEPKPKPAAKVAAGPAKGKATPAQQHGQLKAAVTTGRMSPFAAVEQLLKGH